MSERARTSSSRPPPPSGECEETRVVPPPPPTAAGTDETGAPRATKPPGALEETAATVPPKPLRALEETDATVPPKPLRALEETDATRPPRTAPTFEDTSAKRAPEATVGPPAEPPVSTERGGVLGPGACFDDYRLTQRLGGGAMGEVFEAQDLLLERPVAIKLIHRGAVDETARVRFAIEARAIARMQHPNVVSIYRVGEAAGRPYLVSELVRGTPLDALPVPVTPELALRIATDIAGALAAAHRRGVVHRDIKPANAILSDDGAVKLLDFGIAKLVAHDPAAAQSSKPRSGTTAMRMGEHTESGPGGAVGTPRYMAPEVWLGQPATFQSDIYSLGALLFRLCAGRPPHLSDDYESLRTLVTTTQAPALASVATDADPRLAAVVDQCLQRDPAHRPRSGGELRTMLAELQPDARAPSRAVPNPYRGLRAFEHEHRDLFFGRDSEIRMVLDRLQSDPFVLVSGDSGVGKSSLCRAGVLPRVAQRLGRERRWECALWIPGVHPVAALSTALATPLGLSEQEIGRSIEQDPAGLARTLRAWQGTDRGLLLFVDQAEELVTLSDAHQAAAVAELLGWLVAPSPGFRLLGAARADYLSRMTDLPHIGGKVAPALYFARPLSAERMREIVVEPAHSQGVSFDPPELVGELADSALKTEGGLPLLQFALAELWDARPPQSSRITRQTLESLGGVTGALSRHADTVLAALSDEGKEAAKSLLLRLVTPERTRARRALNDLLTGARAGSSAAGPEPGPTTAALDALVKGRLVVVRQTPEGPAYEIAHEALVDGWDTLREWLSTGTEARRARERLEQAVEEWTRHGSKRELLWGRAQLAELDRLSVEAVAEETKRFVQQSRWQLRARRARRIGAAVAVPLAGALGYTLVVLLTWSDLNYRIDHEQLAARVGQSWGAQLEQRAEELGSRALAQFDDGKEPEAERLWREHGRLLDTLEVTRQRAAGHLEAALLLDPSRRDVRAQFGLSLFERRRTAERRHDTARGAELMQRLALYDDDHSLRARWDAPQSVRIVAPPTGGVIELGRYESGPDGRYLLVPAGAPGAPPLSRDLPPGSYLASWQAPGGETVRQPFVVRREASAAIEIAVTAPSAVPAGFVYVPAGTVGFGSAMSDEQRRDFFHHVPLHDVAVDGFLVAIHETTYAQWIAYLEALPQPERQARLPHVGSGGFGGGLSLSQNRDGSWELALQPAGAPLRARAGEPLQYPGRSVRQQVDWLALPVTGMTAAQAEEYAAWLDRSGQVPGARLCTEHEWERAARGADGREYPHGDSLGPDEANHDQTYDKSPLSMGPDEVGSYPASASPFGVLDMAGNAWEWARSSLHAGQYSARGGSYNFGANSSRATDRELTEPDFRDASVGLRVCASGPAATADAHR